MVSTGILLWQTTVNPSNAELWMSGPQNAAIGLRRFAEHWPPWGSLDSGGSVGEEAQNPEKS